MLRQCDAKGNTSSSQSAAKAIIPEEASPGMIWRTYNYVTSFFVRAPNEKKVHVSPTVETKKISSPALPPSPATEYRNLLTRNHEPIEIKPVKREAKQISVQQFYDALREILNTKGEENKKTDQFWVKQVRGLFGGVEGITNKKGELIASLVPDGIHDMIVEMDRYHAAKYDPETIVKKIQIKACQRLENTGCFSRLINYFFSKPLSRTQCTHNLYKIFETLNVENPISVTQSYRKLCFWAKEFRRDVVEKPVFGLLRITEP